MAKLHFISVAPVYIHVYYTLWYSHGFVYINYFSHAAIAFSNVH